MSEVIRELPIQELLRPTVTPEMGFQSYEMLGDQTEIRDEQQKTFLEGHVLSPELVYPLIDEATLKTGIERLNTVGERTRNIDDQDVSDAVWNSAGYRLAEMYWLKEAKRLNELSYVPDSAEFALSAERYQTMNEQLYGVPDQITTGMVVGEILMQAHGKQLDERAQKILQELEEGTQVEVADQTILVRGLKGMEQGRLPEIEGKLNVLSEVLREEFDYVFTLVDQYWDEVVRLKEYPEGIEPHLTMDDAHELFTQMRDAIDPENKAGISIVFSDTAKTIVWDTPTMSVKIGRKHASIKDTAEMAYRLIHELGWHGGRAVHGLQTELPVLGTGLYTEALENEQPDYLTFEEGIATLGDMALSGNTEKWKAVHISHYLNTALAYEGASFRESFEVTWRARALMTVLDGEPLTDAIINAQRKQAYISLIRVKRGTPTHVEHDKPLTYNKDLAYLQGKLGALRFLEQVGTDKAAIRQTLRGKFDPLNAAQKKLADRYIPAA